MGFGQVFLECHPVDIRAVFSWIPAVTTREEQVLLVRRDPWAMFNVDGVNPRAQIARFRPGAIRQA